jgi:RNA polymerase-associated protein RTF1
LTKRRKDQNWAKVNERASQMNQTADFESYKAQQAREKAEAKAAPTFNPYARRKVKPKILWEVGQKDENKEDEATAGKDSDVREDAGAETHDEPTHHTVLATQKPSYIGESHEFNIDEEVLVKSGTSNKPNKRNGTRVRKGISLAEYLERKAAGTL